LLTGRWWWVIFRCAGTLKSMWEIVISTLPFRHLSHHQNRTMHFFPTTEVHIGNNSNSTEAKFKRECSILSWILGQKSFWWRGSRGTFRVWWIIMLSLQSTFWKYHIWNHQIKDLRKENLRANLYYLPFFLNNCRGHDTVGAVALDSFGNVACATSTGGIRNKMVGRVGDSPIIGESDQRWRTEIISVSHQHSFWSSVSIEWAISVWKCQLWSILNCQSG